MELKCQTKKTFDVIFKNKTEIYNFKALENIEEALSDGKGEVGKEVDGVKVEDKGIDESFEYELEGDNFLQFLPDEVNCNFHVFEEFVGVLKGLVVLGMFLVVF